MKTIPFAGCGKPLQRTEGYIKSKAKIGRHTFYHNECLVKANKERYERYRIKSKSLFRKNIY